MDAPATPRTYVIAAVSGDAVTLTTNEVEQIFSQSLRGVSKVRIWNVSKTPAQAAWVKWNSSANIFNVHQASDVAGWAAGESLRLGDPNPTGANTLGMIALDISDYLFNNYGVVFPQRGLKLSIAPQGVGGRVGLDCSGNGAVGTALGNSSNSDGSRQSAFADILPQFCHRSLILTYCSCAKPSSPQQLPLPLRDCYAWLDYGFRGK